MIFSSLSGRLQEIMARLRGRGRLSEADIKAALREIKLALLEADVNYKVVKDFVARVQQRCLEAEVLGSLTPGQNVVRVVRDELTELLGADNAQLAENTRGPSVYMLVGLQGMGKTTTTVKLAAHLQKKGKKPVVVSLDTQRPAAREQLALAAQQAGVAVLSPGGDDAVALARQARAQFAQAGYNCLLLDTAGRQHIDQGLMEELVTIRTLVQPTEVILVLDAMAGQDAVNVAQGFAGKDLADSIILTKLDSDARGGAALSVRAVTGKPIKFVGVGEKYDQLQPFHPQRIASQILGMGDVLTLIEKAEQTFNREEAAKLQQKLRKQQFTLDDFRQQLAQFRQMGSLEEVFSMLPGPAKLGNIRLDDKELVHIDAIISSMTAQERAHPEIINGSRRKRIAMGSGTTVQQVNRLLKQFAAMQKMFKQLDGRFAKKGKLPFPFKF